MELKFFSQIHEPCNFCAADILKSINQSIYTSVIPAVSQSKDVSVFKLANKKVHTQRQHPKHTKSHSSNRKLSQRRAPDVRKHTPEHRRRHTPNTHRKRTALVLGPATHSHRQVLRLEEVVFFFVKCLGSHIQGAPSDVIPLSCDVLGLNTCGNFQLSSRTTIWMEEHTDAVCDTSRFVSGCSIQELIKQIVFSAETRDEADNLVQSFGPGGSHFSSATNCG